MRSAVLGSATAVLLALGGLVAAAPASAATSTEPPVASVGVSSPVTDAGADARVSAQSTAAPVESEPGLRAAAPADTLFSGESLAVGDELVSANGRWALVMDVFGLYVVEKSPYAVEPGAFHGDVLFSSAGNLTGATLRTDGNLVVSEDGIARASSGTSGSGAVTVRVLDNGNVAMRDGSGRLVEQFGLHRVSTLYPGARLLTGQSLVGDGGATTVTMQADGNLVLRQSGRARWSSGTASFPGAFAVLQLDGNLVVRDADGIARWSTRTSNLGVDAAGVVQNGGFYVFGDGQTPFETMTSYDLLRTGQRLASGATLRSFSGDCTLQMQVNGNLVVRCLGRVVFTSGTFFARSTATMQADGNLVVRDSAGRARWSTGTRVAGSYLLLFGTPERNPFVVLDESGAETGDVLGLVDPRTDDVVWSR